MTLENIIWEAKQRPSTLKDSRRPSTTIDDNGCTIVKGFVVPSRTSSFDSIATASSSSYETPGTPLSPIEEPAPGFSRPSGSLYDAAELRCIKDQSLRSLHRPARSAGSIEFGARPRRPSIAVRRSTWQQQRTSRLSDEDLLNTKCKFSSGLALELARQKARTEGAHEEDAKFDASKIALRRNKTEPVALDRLNTEPGKRSPRRQPKPVKRKDSKTMNATEADSAIASDSEDDEEPLAPTPGFAMGGIAAQRLRPTYAARRALRDDRAAQIQQQRRDTTSTEQEAPPPKVDFARMYQAGSAIESDDEEDDADEDDCVAAALNLARIHRSRNSVTARIISDDSNDITQARMVNPETEEPPCAPKAKLVPMRFQDDRLELPTVETKAFGHESPVAHKPLRPSRSQPRPIKGVLKYSCSRGTSPSSRDTPAADATTRRGSVPIITEPSEAKASLAFTQKSKSTLALSNLSVHFTTTN